MAVIKNKALDTFDYEEKLINFIMKHGKKSVAKKIYADTLKDIKASWHMNPSVVVRTAIENASPTIMIKSKRIWGAVYQVPVEVKADKRFFYVFGSSCVIWVPKGCKQTFQRHFQSFAVKEYTSENECFKEAWSMKDSWTYKKLDEVGTVIGGNTPKTDVPEF